MKVCINAGHYPSKDSGAVGRTGLQEAHVTQDIMRLVMYYLQHADYETLEVQENELYQITDASNNFGADLFVSIHCNSASNPDAYGTETFCYRFGGESEKLANCIQKQIVSSMELGDRGIKEGNFAVLRDTNCPAVLVECAFISNAEEELLLASEQGKDDFARAIARGVTDYVANIQASQG